MQRPQWISHTTFFKIGCVATFMFFLGFMVVVVSVAQTRQSGVTGLDASEIFQKRIEAQRLEKLQRESEGRWVAEETPD